MADLLTALRASVLLADGATGSHFFQTTGRLSEPQHVYEAFNVDRQDLVLHAHGTYLEAGARCLSTNTFAANRSQLTPLGESHRITELNQAVLIEISRI